LKNMWSGILLSVLGGVFLTLGFPKLGWYYFSWVALIPLFLALPDRTTKQAFALGCICGLVHYVGTLYWMYYALHQYGGIPTSLAIVVVFLPCTYLALYLGCFAAIARVWLAYPLLWVLGLPGVWVALELIRAHVFTGFPWANLGYTQTPLHALIQIADLSGVYGVSWLVVLSSTVLTALLRRSRGRYAGLLVLGVCLVGAFIYGSWREGTIDDQQSAATPWIVGVVQGNIDQSQKWDAAFQQETLKRYLGLSKEAAAHNPAPELLVWPETAVPFFYRLEEKLTAQLTDIVKETGTPLLFGSPGMTIIEGAPRLQNRAYLVNGSAVLEGVYAKQHLVPFGEYVPLQQVLFFIHRLVQAAGDFVPGDDPSPLILGRQPFGVLICYEDIFPELARAAVERGATSLINITNDAWYGTSSAPYQHLELARWRAIEFRVPLIRAANTGISAIFDATGKSCGTISLNQPGFLVCPVHPFRILTFYAKWGDLFAWLCLLTTAGALIYSRLATRSSPSGPARRLFT
jgi:apolipoprotein N-acyltransferase